MNKLFSFLFFSFLLALSFNAHAAPISDTFNYTGAAQTFNVPPNVTSVTIETRGAQGGEVTQQQPLPQGGLGATMIGTFAVSGGDVLTVVVGGRGNPDPSTSGGGGGSGVNQSGTALIVAGGGAGVDFQDPSYAGQHAVVITSGVAGSVGGGAAGVGGAAGGNTIFLAVNISQGGNGWNDGNSGSTGLDGVSANATTTNGTFGLGGGGGSVGFGFCNCGGGGGGYSGGGSGALNRSGGGGGSFNSGTGQINTGGVQTGDGLVVITYEVIAPVPTSVPSLSIWGLVALTGLLGLFGIRRRHMK